MRASVGSSLETALAKQHASSAAELRGAAELLRTKAAVDDNTAEWTKAELLGYCCRSTLQLTDSRPSSDITCTGLCPLLHRRNASRPSAGAGSMTNTEAATSLEVPSFGQSTASSKTPARLFASWKEYP